MKAQARVTQLSLALLGPLQITLSGTPVRSFDSDKVRALLVYLAVEAERAHRREALAGLLWPEHAERAARHNLSQALFNARQALADHRADPPFLLVTRDTVQFNLAGAQRIDVVDFSALLAACGAHRHRRIATCAACARRLTEAAELYRGAFLEQFSLADSVAFDEWAALKREELHRRATEALATLATYHELRGAYAHARDYAWRQLALDPWREETHRHLMRLLLRSGQRSAALAQFEACKNVLQRELGVSPEEETIALYERIRAAGPGATADPLSFTAAHPSRLPPAPTPFVGREAELAELEELLVNPARRLVTIVGPGGFGKTRLALQAAEQQQPFFADGVHWVPLAALGSAALLVSAIADGLHWTLDGQADPKAQLLDMLAARHLLLLLDSFEHLLPGATLLHEILQRAPNVQLLVTSRERLNLQWEWIFDIAGLAFPQSDSRAPLESFSAIQLFVQRVRQVRRQWALDDDDAREVVRICRFVEGMPLAIELTAAAVRDRSCRQIAEHLETERQLLATPRLDVPARHHSLRAVFDHSWQLLTLEERRVLGKLAVFRGGCDGDAAAAVADASESSLTALINKSLVRRIPTAAGERYDQHELIRQYAFTQLETAGLAQQTGDRHLAFFAQLAADAEPHLTGAQQPGWLQRLEAEHGNVRSALDWATAHDRGATAVRICAAIWRFWHIRGYLDEGREWIRRALASTASQVDGGGADTDLTAPAAHAQALKGAGILAWAQSDYAEAGAAFDASLALFAQLHDTDGIAGVSSNLAVLAIGRGDYAQATQLLHTSLALRRELGDRWGTASCLANLGAMAGKRGDTTAAQAYYEEALALYRELGYERGIATMLGNLGDVAEERGQVEQADRLFTESLQMLRRLGDKAGTAATLTASGALALRRRDLAGARACFTESLMLVQELGDREYAAICFEGFAAIAATNQPERAARLWGAAEALRAAIDVPLPPGKRADFKDILAEARSRYGEPAFSQAWSEGGTLALEQTIAYALERGPTEQPT